MLTTTLAKITDDQRAKGAIVYIRQSSPGQLRDNRESRLLQYDLRDLARELGFREVEVIDEDLGRTSSGAVDRPGFEHLFSLVASGQVGAVFCQLVDRLARNGQDWSMLLDACAFVGAVLVSPDGVADPRDSNDRLLLGLKGTLAEYELTLLRQRAIEARRHKADRGMFRIRVPVGYRWTVDDQVVQEPDQRVREAIELVFRKFTELRSIRQVHRWFCHEELSLPVLRSTRRWEPHIEWALPTYGTIHRLVKNPAYAGAYVFGKAAHKSELINGRIRKRRVGIRPLEAWDVLIQDHHPAYISWDEFERNQQTLAENNYRMERVTSRPGRGGRALLVGLVRCARCGRRLHITYSGANGKVIRYSCHRGRIGYGLGPCLSFGGHDVDARVSEEVIEVLRPRAIEASLAASAQIDRRLDDQEAALCNELEQARYQAHLAARRYEAVDPDKRLVACELEARWNRALEDVQEVEQRLAHLDAERQAHRPVDEAQLRALAVDLPRVWHAPSADMRLKQRIVQLLLEEIVVDIDDEQSEVVLVLHWKGGCHSEVRVGKRRSGQTSRTVAPDVLELIREMAGRWRDDDMAALLNRLGARTGAGNPWTRARVRSLRAKQGLAPYDADRASAYVNLKEAAKKLGVSETAVRRLIKVKVLPALQVCSGARWEIHRDDLVLEEVERQAAAVRSGRRRRDAPQSLDLPGLGGNLAADDRARDLAAVAPAPLDDDEQA